MTAKLAHGDHGETTRLGVWHALGDGRRHGAVDRPVGKIGQVPRDLFQPKFAGEITKRHGKRQRASLPAQLGHEIEIAVNYRSVRGGLGAARQKQFDYVAPGHRCTAQERGAVLGPTQCTNPFNSDRFARHASNCTVTRATRKQLLAVTGRLEGP